MSNIPICSLCLYCQKNIADTREHIFPSFLGGSMTIKACRKCNNSFGTQFESKAANNYFSQIHILIVDMGIKLKNITALWKNACTNNDGLRFSIKSNGKKNETYLPSRRKLQDGCFVYPNRGDFDKMNSSLSNEKKLSELNLKQEQFKRLRTRYTLVMNDYVKRTALKMCLAYAATLPNLQLSEIRDACDDLCDVSNKFLHRVKVPYFKYTSLESWKTRGKTSLSPESIQVLNHIIYVERNQSKICGIVQFFGIFQVYCNLGKNISKAEEAAILGELDPVTGKERFRNVMVQCFPEPTNEDQITTSCKIQYANECSQQLYDDIIKRGGNSKYTLELPKILYNYNSKLNCWD